MGVILHLLTYICIAVFLAAVVKKYTQYKNMPMHLRWELYPVAHEGHKAHYGGSYFEEEEWYNNLSKPDMVSELKHMLPEMIFLVAVKEHNKKLWYRTFPFHFGMYSLIGFLFLMMAGAVLMLTGTEVALPVSGQPNGIGQLLAIAITAVAFFGAGLGIIGALGLLARRLGDDDLKDFTKPSDIFNLVFLLATFGAILAAGLADPGYAGLITFVKSVITFQISYAPPVATIPAIVIGSLVVAYIPLTHMAHFVVKYFTYHNIRWDDSPNLKGGEWEPKIGEVLNYKVTWKADHVNPTGADKTWADIATENPIKEGK